MGIIGDDPHTELIVDNAKAYVGANFQQFSPHGPESIASLVNTKEAYYQQLESNTHDLYLNLKLRHILVQHYRLVMVKLDETCAQEEAEASTCGQDEDRQSHYVFFSQNLCSLVEE